MRRIKSRRIKKCRGFERKQYQIYKIIASAISYNSDDWNRYMNYCIEYDKFTNLVQDIYKSIDYDESKLTSDQLAYITETQSRLNSGKEFYDCVWNWIESEFKLLGELYTSGKLKLKIKSISFIKDTVMYEGQFIPDRLRVYTFQLIDEDNNPFWYKLENNSFIKYNSSSYIKLIIKL